jgi:hypothetical protein
MGKEVVLPLVLLSVGFRVLFLAEYPGRTSIPLLQFVVPAEAGTYAEYPGVEHAALMTAVPAYSAWGE